MACNAYGAAKEMTEEQIDTDLLQLSIDQVERSDQSVIGKLDDKDDRVQRLLARNHRDFAMKSYDDFNKMDPSAIPSAPIDGDGIFGNKGNYYLNLEAPSKAVYVINRLGKTYINLVALLHNAKAKMIEDNANNRLAAKEKTLPMAKAVATDHSGMHITVLTDDVRWGPNGSLQGKVTINTLNGNHGVYTIPSLSGHTWIGLGTQEFGYATSISASICGVTPSQSGYYAFPAGPGFPAGWWRQGSANTSCLITNKRVHQDPRFLALGSRSLVRREAGIVRFVLPYSNT
jgi:hypothetical protein